MGEVTHVTDNDKSSEHKTDLPQWPKRSLPKDLFWEQEVAV